jgi:hypothetical protein
MTEALGDARRRVRAVLSTPQYLLRLVLLAVAYFVVARLGLGLAAVHPVISPLWPPTGVALAALILGGRRLWPAVLVSSFAVNVDAIGAVTSFFVAVGNTLEALAGAWICRSLAGRVRPLTRLEDALRLLAAAALAPVISATTGIGTLVTAGALAGDVAPVAWVVWWSGEALGALLVAPMLLAWAGLPPGFRSWQRALEAVLLATALVSLSFLAFTRGSVPPAMAYSMLVWASLRFGLRGGTMAGAVLVVIAAAATGSGLGPLVGGTAAESAFNLQVVAGFAVVLAVLLGAAMDERHAALREVRAVARVRQTVIDGSPFAVVALDPAGRVITWNRAATDLFGWTAHEAIGHPLRVVPPESAAHATQLRSLLAGGQRLVRQPLERVHRDGHSLSLELTASPMHDDEGRIIGAIGVYEDVSGLLRAERQAADSVRRLQLLVESAVDAIVSADEHGLITGWDGRAEAIFGWTREEAVGRSLAETVIPDRYYDAHARAYQHLAATAQGRVQWPLELVGRRKDGSELPVELVVSHAELDGQLQFSAFIRDVTDRRRAEDALRQSEEQLLQAQKMEAIGRLAGGVAHDFNNLLTSILSFADLVTDQLQPTDPAVDDVREIKSAALRAATLTRQLLAFGRRQLLEPRVLDANGVITAVGAMLGRLLGSDVAVVTELDPDLQHVRVDRGQLEQVLVNLAVNSRDAMPDGGVLRISTRNARVGTAMAATHVDLAVGDYVVIRVADTGQGMDAATLERAFEPFYTTKEAGKGTGLGLSTVYGIVRQHQGAVLVDSHLGDGARFDVYLPAVSEPEETEAAASAQHRPEGGAELVLLVEDEETIRGLAERVLRQYGYTVLVARNTAEAEVLAAETAGIALLLTDVVMPGGSGLVLAATLRSRMPELKVLVMSGFTGEHGEAAPVPEGTPFLAKPFGPDELARKVREALDG